MKTIEVKLVEIRAIVEVVRRTVAEWETFVGSVGILLREHEAFRTRCDSLERQVDELRGIEASLRREQQANLRHLSELRIAQEALVRAHEQSTGELADLHLRHDALMEERRQLAAEVEAIVRRLRSM